MNPIREVAIVGAGRMGRGIALSFAYGGIRAVLIDLKSRSDAEQERLFEEAQHEIRGDLQFLESQGLLSGVQVNAIIDSIRCVPVSGSKEALADATLVFDAVPEVKEAKADCFQFVSENAPAEAIVASTTSTFLVTDLQAMVSNPERFLNAHWLNPAHLMPLVEISRSDVTAQQTVDNLRRILESIGKVPVVCGPAPGYIVPRIQALAMNEAARMVEEGVASAEEIDKAVRVGFGLRFAVLGMLEFIDWGGGDILYYASNYLKGELGERYSCPEVVENNMHQKRNGLRDGVGFYDYAGKDTRAYRESRLTDFIRMLEGQDLLPVCNPVSGKPS